MHSKDLRRRFIDFFVTKHGHTEISGASLVPENDPTVLFTTAGMHPLVPYLMGEAHPSGRRLVDAQKCVRTGDIDEVGDATHLTFFEMLGNWSLGDYFKEKAIQMSYKFLTSPIAEGGLGLPVEMLGVTCFGGDERFSEMERDEESAEVWRGLGITEDRIAFVPGGVLKSEDNWWGPAGQTGPCGPSSEMFYWKGKGDAPKIFDAKDENWVEIWNDVFMQYNKTAEGTFVPLKQQNVDTGLGLERVVAVLQGVPTVFETDLFVPVMEKIYGLSSHNILDSNGQQQPLDEEEKKSSRIIADHLRAAVFILADPRAVRPSNTDQGYVLRRLIRRAIIHGRELGILDFFAVKIADVFIDQYKDVYPELQRNFDFIRAELQKEEDKFRSTLQQGLKIFEKIEERIKHFEKMGEANFDDIVLNGKEGFYLYETYGFPLQSILEEAKKRNIQLHPNFSNDFQNALKAHQEKSRAGATQKFHGGLADSHEETVKLHTATHLLHQALREVLGDHVYQQGSNITQERLRFDFTHPEKLTDEQKAQVEARVNEAIAADVPVHYEMMTVDEAKKRHAIGLFPDRYDERIKVYCMGPFSTEICGGPHVSHTGVLGQFKIKKEESCAAGIRRIKAVVSEGQSGIDFAEEKL